MHMATIPPRTLRLSVIPLSCPLCRSELRPAAPAIDDIDRLECLGCGTRWPVRFGIPDLRPPHVCDPYLSEDEDLRAAERLFARGATGGFAEALATYYEQNERVTPAQARQFISGTMAALGRATTVLETWLAWSNTTPSATSTLVDVGSGTGPLAVAAARTGYSVLAVDVGMRWLVLAALRARESKVAVTFACAGADALPLRSGGASVVAGESILENVVALDGVVREAARVLAPHGWFWITTANRWSLGPDPHVGLPMGGWFPPPVVAAYARRRGMVPPKRRLLGAGELRRLLRQHGLRTTRLGPPPMSESQRANTAGAMRLAVHGYELIRRVPPGRRFLQTFGPTLVAVAHR